MLSIRETMLTQSAKPEMYCDSDCSLSPFCSDVNTWLSSLISVCGLGVSRSEVSGEDEDGKLASGYGGSCTSRASLILEIIKVVQSIPCVSNESNSEVFGSLGSSTYIRDEHWGQSWATVTSPFLIS